jgi:hypothetical protein
MEWGEEKPIQYRTIYAADTNETNEIPEMKARLLRLESELERINKLLMNSDLLDPEFAAVITDHFWELS